MRTMVPFLASKGCRMLVSSLIAAVLAACTGGPREQPGDQPNARLVELVNDSLDGHLRRLDPAWSPEYLPQAAAHARAWLQRVRSATAYCRYGPGNRTRHNLFLYDLELVDGQRIEAVPGFRRCTYEGPLPLVMQVDFEAGRAHRVLTDGRERRSPVAQAANDIEAFTTALLHVDQARQPQLYRPPQDVGAQWRR